MAAGDEGAVPRSRRRMVAMVAVVLRFWKLFKGEVLDGGKWGRFVGCERGLYVFM